jgi:thymidylate synthase ThyX
MYYANVILDSVNKEYNKSRITTFEICAPRFLLAEINTHRVLTKSAASSRAIPIKKRIDMVRQSPFIPEAFGKNKPGMQADENLDEDTNTKATIVWKNAINYALTFAEEMVDLNVHKQQANRLLEPFCFYNGVITGTEWENFYNLRLHPDAQPEFQKLAKLMKDAHDASIPVVRNHHLPYADTMNDLVVAFKVSAARCARVSYKTFDGKVSNYEDDLNLCESLIKGGHMSPFDHQAIADTTYIEDDLRYWKKPRLHRQYYGWIPNRVYIERMNGMTQPRNSYDPIPNT